MNTWAMNFDRAVVPLVSSITPRPSISVHVTSAAAEWLLVRLITSKNGRNWETASATTKPTYIAMPPIVGSGTRCTDRSLGW